MDTSNQRLNQGASGDVADSSMESGDWRSHLHPDFRQSIINKIVDILPTRLPSPIPGGRQELERIVVNLEEKIYTDATSKSDYKRKMYEKTMTVGKRPQNAKSNSAAVNVNSLYTAVASLDLTAEKGNPDGKDWQEEVYQKIKAMKDLYLQDLNDMHQETLDQLQKHGSLPQQPDNGQLEKLRVFKMTLERYMHFLQIPKHDILVNYKDKLATFEMQVVNIVNSNKRKAAAQEQQPQAPLPPNMHSGGSLQQNVLRGPPQENINQTLLQNDGIVIAVDSNKRKRVVQQQQQQQAPLPPHVHSGGSQQQNAMSGPQQVYINPTSLHQNVQQQQQAPLPPHVHSGGSLQQNTPRGTQQVNINPTLQQNLGGGGASGGFMESGNWKALMTADSRRSIVNKITDSLKTHLQYFGFEGIPELMKISERFEESVFTAATSQSEYLRILTLKMMDLEFGQLHTTPAAYMH